MTAWMKEGLGLNAFESWLFMPGALYDSSSIWWKSRTNYVRAYPHEGIDFYYYKSNESNMILHVAEGTSVPLIMDGSLESVFKDFIGLSFVFATDNYRQMNGQRFRFYIVYAHVKPTKPLTLVLGKQHKAHDILFTYNQQVKKFAPPHLHITTFWGDEQFNSKNVSWDILDTSAHVILVNPLLTEIH